MRGGMIWVRDRGGAGKGKADRTAARHSLLRCAVRSRRPTWWRVGARVTLPLPLPLTLPLPLPLPLTLTLTLTLARHMEQAADVRQPQSRRQRPRGLA